MRRKQVYILSALALLFIIIGAGYIFCNHPFEKEPAVVEEERYTYLPKYVHLSDYDDDFRDAAQILECDWTLIAAIAYTESRFDSTAISEAGARGVMQVMPNTMRGFNIPDSMHMDTRTNIMVATEYLRSLNRRFKYIRDPKERLNFILASYNAGYGHVQDAMQLAKKYGKNRFVWNNSVDTFLILKKEPEFYKDSVCNNGRFTGWRETLSFVKKVQRYWDDFSTRQQQYTDSINIVVANDSTKRIEE